MPIAIASRTDPLRVAQALGTSLAIALGASCPDALANVSFPPHVVLISRLGPPPPLIEPQGKPVKGKVWSPGFWKYNGLDYKWIAGSYVAERPGMRWKGAHWRQDGERWLFAVGHWEKAS